MSLFVLSVLGYLFPALVGVVVGSYLNSWMWRVREGRWQWGGRSMCVHCNRPLLWYENIPLLSFVFLRGRCRTCHGVIPVDYFLVELCVPLLFVAVTYFHLTYTTLNAWHYFRDICFACVLVVVFVYDAKYMEILSGLAWLGTLTALAINHFALHYSWYSLLLGMIVGGGFFLLQYVVSRGRWIGGGDVRLGTMMGVLLAWPTILVALLVSYTVGAVVAIPLLLSKNKQLQSQIPFGTFLAIGTLVAMFFGNALIVWYRGLMGL